MSLKHKLIALIFLNSLVYSQKVQTGIYEVIYDTDTTFVHQNTIKENPQDQYNNIKYIYNYNYTNYIDKANEINYAVIIKTENPQDKSQYNLDIVLLNKKIGADYNWSYSDKIKRKFFLKKIAIKGTAPSDRFYNENDFGNNYFLNIGSQKEYPSIYGEETGQYTSNCYSIKNNYFFIKSNLYEPVINSIKVDSSTYYNNPLVGSGFQKSTQFVTLNQAVVAFKPKELKNYSAFLSVKIDSVKFYTDDKSNLILNEGDFIAVTTETDEWILGDFIDTNGKVTSGKIFSDDLINSKTQTTSKNGLKLETKYTLFNENMGWNQLGTISKIKTYYNKKLIQVIKNAGFVSDSLAVLDFDDVNFDGHDDLVVYSHDGGAGPNYGNNYFIFNPKTKKFVFNEIMSDLTQPQVNHKTKTILAAWRNGAANHGSEKYKWIKNNLILVESYETNYIDEDKFKETHLFLINGKMRPKPKKAKVKKVK